MGFWQGAAQALRDKSDEMVQDRRIKGEQERQDKMRLEDRKYRTSERVAGQEFAVSMADKKAREDRLRAIAALKMTRGAAKKGAEPNVNYVSALRSRVEGSPEYETWFKKYENNPRAAQIAFEALQEAEKEREFNMTPAEITALVNTFVQDNGDIVVDIPSAEEIMDMDLEEYLELEANLQPRSSPDPVAVVGGPKKPRIAEAEKMFLGEVAMLAAAKEAELQEKGSDNLTTDEAQELSDLGVWLKGQDKTANQARLVQKFGEDALGNLTQYVDGHPFLGSLRYSPLVRPLMGDQVNTTPKYGNTEATVSPQDRENIKALWPNASQEFKDRWMKIDPTFDPEG